MKLKKRPRNNSGQLMLTYQAYNPGFETKITQIKTNYEVQFSINPILKEKIKKKLIKKNS
jgi:hypothetical protein